ncbi:MAG: hypothetical protein M0R30_11620 [Methanoregula sp.]|jgi:hypothetical protein|uniref:hypothetical protein n=1 Tax=Methanoregula sp. TaxID=2052170 RepID=UPI0025E07B99|nr:hypothetical protein [Methanoregula sp.]MCK9632272.1 hypothetical protein [Methanoregula sp.]
MVQIGEIYLGGKEGDPHNGNVFNCGVSYSLSEKSPVDGIYEFESGKWETEIQKNNQNIIARCRDILTEEQIITQGFEYCQKYLDILSVTHKSQLMTQRPGQKYILLFSKEGRTFLRIISNADFGFSLEANLTVGDKNGNLIEPPPVPTLHWIPAFRYYRISQSETDPYQAYQELYLAFEELLQEIAPRRKREGESDWLLRALSTVEQQIPLNTLLPNSQNPMAEIKEHHYKNFRCKLFHAKDGDYILPNDCPNPKDLYKAYEELIMIWRQIAFTFKNVPRKGGGLTYFGFMSMMDYLANCGVQMQFTDDLTPGNTSDTKISPLEHPVYSSTKNEYIRDYSPGIALFKGTLENPEQTGLTVIHRFGLVDKGELVSIASYQDGIYIKGIDVLEGYETARLINTASPKTIF